MRGALATLSGETMEVPFKRTYQPGITKIYNGQVVDGPPELWLEYEGETPTLQGNKVAQMKEKADTYLGKAILKLLEMYEEAAATKPDVSEEKDMAPRLAKKAAVG